MHQQECFTGYSCKILDKTFERIKCISKSPKLTTKLSIMLAISFLPSDLASSADVCKNARMSKKPPKDSVKVFPNCALWR
jgi:hypothetical protein